MNHGIVLLLHWLLVYVVNQTPSAKAQRLHASFVAPPYTSFVGRSRQPLRQRAKGESFMLQVPSPSHVVDGVSCREVSIVLPTVGTVKVLEATAESQDLLVDMAIDFEVEAEFAVSEQKLRAGDPYGAVLWPASWAVANYILTELNLPHAVNAQTDKPLAGCSVLELGTGTGLLAISAALGGAHVVATDYEPLALTLTKHASEKFHGVSVETQLLDLSDYTVPIPPADLVVAADIMYEPRTGIAMAHRAVEALRQGSRVVVGDSPGRPGRSAFLDTLQALGVSNAEFVDKLGWTCSGPRHELICGLGSTSVSNTPQELPVAILDLVPSMLQTPVQR